MDENKKHGSVGHETRDADVRSVSKFGLGILGGVVISMVLMWILFGRLEVKETEESGKPEIMATRNSQKLPPEPRLQPTPVVDYKAFRASEDVLLNDYSWVDPEKGIVRIPVDRALELVAKEGLPSRQEAKSK